MEWKFTCTRMWLDYIDEGNSIPVPFNLVYYSVLLFYIPLYFFCECCKKGKCSCYQTVGVFPSPENLMVLRSNSPTPLNLLFSPFLSRVELNGIRFTLSQSCWHQTFSYLISECKNIRTSERANERTSERANERTSERANERTSERANERTNERTSERANERTSERANERTNERNERTNEQKNERKQNKRYFPLRSQIFSTWFIKEARYQLFQW